MSCITLKEKIQEIAAAANTFAYILDMAERALMSDELPSGECKCGHHKSEHKYSKGNCLDYGENGKPCECSSFSGR